jgi:hypothetical protein
VTQTVGEGIGDVFNGLCTGTALMLARAEDHHDVAELILDYYKFLKEKKLRKAKDLKR